MTMVMATQAHFLKRSGFRHRIQSGHELMKGRNVQRDERMEQLLQAAHSRAGGDAIMISIVEGASAASSRVIRSPMPPSIVVPPDN